MNQATTTTPPTADAIGSTAYTFRYRGQTTQGVELSGTIDANDIDDARWRLQGMGVRVFDIEKAGETKPRSAPALSGDDLVAFNQQLAQLASSGIPLERGLQLIARDMVSGRLRKAIKRLADDLASGRSLDEAINNQKGQFPALYGSLLKAGIASGRLDAVLMNLGRHLSMMQRLREAIWQAFAYPATVLFSLSIVMWFIGWTVIPVIQRTLNEDLMVGELVAGTPPLPYTTHLVFVLAQAMPVILGGVLVVFSLGSFAWWLADRFGILFGLASRTCLHVPIIGPILHRNLLARWTDALAITTHAGLDLPTAIELAGDTVRWPSIRKDGDTLRAGIEAGMPCSEATNLRTLPATIPALMDLSIHRGDLPDTLSSLSELYQQQAEQRLSVLRSLLQPILIVLSALLVAIVMHGVLAPLLHMLNAFMWLG